MILNTFRCIEEGYALVARSSRSTKLNSEYEELVLESVFRVETRLVESIFRLGASTAKYLRLTAELEREHMRDFISTAHPNQILMLWSEWQRQSVTFDNSESWK